MVMSEVNVDIDAWFQNKKEQINRFNAINVFGRVTGVGGILLECHLPSARLGDLCMVQGKSEEPIMAEIVGFTPNNVLLSALSQVDGIAQGARVTPLYVAHSIVTNDNLLGCVLDGFGRAIEPGGIDAFTIPGESQTYTQVISDPPLPTDRPRIDSPLVTGIRAIDGLLTIGLGQRVGVFAGAGCGKTTLLAELARNTPCDVIVFGLIGERGRELREFLDHELDETLRSRTVMVCSTSDRSSMERARAAFTATAIAESYRDKGKNVLLILDSLTRFARAQREIGLALGEPPGRGGLPPSVYTLLPKLLERAGRTNTGSITAFYSVLIESDSMNDPVADEVRSLIDGHIILTRKLAEKGHYPAIDILASLSRTMTNVVDNHHMKQATSVRRLMAAYKQVEMLLRLGEYQKGNDNFTDAAVEAQDYIANFLQQSNRLPCPYDKTRNELDVLSHYAKV
ncbi:MULTISPECIES: FliI/YscN family ATPase [Pantoea]|uniref:FliI/YscN family ATPase n=1 Tax=Pantoea TaxID=53335 RepID=UPI000CF40472|nr:MULTISPECIES: FliI/YscN family ATPase [Pantoea]PQK79983.1 flagellum-specific ATP synthase FliI [Pantoea ananatis]